MSARDRRNRVVSGRWTGDEHPGDRSADAEDWSTHLLQELVRLGYPDKGAVPVGLGEAPVDLGGADAGERLWNRLVDVAAERGFQVFVGPTTDGRGAEVLFGGQFGALDPNYHGAVLVSADHPDRLAAADALATVMATDAGEQASLRGRGPGETSRVQEDREAVALRRLGLDGALAENASRRQATAGALWYRARHDPEVLYHAEVGAAVAEARQRLTGGLEAAPAPAWALPYELVSDRQRNIWAAGISSTAQGYVMTLVPVTVRPGAVPLAASVGDLIEAAAEEMPSGRQPLTAVVLGPRGQHLVVERTAPTTVNRVVGDDAVRKLTGRTVVAHEAMAKEAVTRLTRQDGPAQGGGRPGLGE